MSAGEETVREFITASESTATVVTKPLFIISFVSSPYQESWLFGSSVRGEMREDSDSDILVEIENTVSLPDFVGIKLELEEALRRKVDLVEYCTIKPFLKARIIKYKKFSKIVCVSVIQYYERREDVEKLIEEVRKIAPPGAYFMISDITTGKSLLDLLG